MDNTLHIALTENSPLLIAGNSPPAVPTIVSSTNVDAAARYIEFFAATIRNWNTRDAYHRACDRFLDWCSCQRLDTLVEIEPIHVATYIEIIQFSFERSTVKQHLSAIRTMFDWLVISQIVPVNPTISVRGPRYDVARGTTPILSARDARTFLDRIDTATIAGARDYALVSLMLFSFSRISAALSMRVEDYFAVGNNRWIRLKEKGGKQHEMPANQQLQMAINAYIKAAKIEHEQRTPLFRATSQDGSLLTFSLTRANAYRMIRRWSRVAGISEKIGCHSFRATGITIYLSNGGTLENAQKMAAHKSPRTTKLYDRTHDHVAQKEVERIVI